MRALTVDSLDHPGANPTQIRASLQMLAKITAPDRILIRLVLDPDGDPDAYRQFCETTAPIVDIMPCLADSYALSSISYLRWQRRVRSYLKLLNPYAAIWEIANEINGNWLGNYAYEKAKFALNLVNEAGKLSSVTWYLDFDKPRSIMDFHNRHGSLRSSFHLLSVYPFGEPDPINTMLAKMPAQFVYLAAQYPGRYLGVGEYGTERETPDGKPVKGTLDEKIALVKSMESFLTSESPGGDLKTHSFPWAGMGLCWDYVTDCVSQGSSSAEPLLRIFKEVWKRSYRTS